MSPPLFLAGLSAGVAVAFLAAPYSGVESRRWIGDKAVGGAGLVSAGRTAGEEYVKSCGTGLRDMVKEVVA